MTSYSQEQLELVRVYLAANAIEANVISGLLTSECIPVELTGGGLAGAIGELPVSASEVGVWVPALKVTEANKVLAQYESRIRSKGSEWECPNCNEVNQDSFEICWNCQQDKSP